MDKDVISGKKNPTLRDHIYLSCAFCTAAYRNVPRKPRRERGDEPAQFKYQF